MDAVLLARLQFAFTIGFHILWPTFTIGLACFIALLSGLWWRTGRTVYRDLMRFWLRIFALAFGMPGTYARRRRNAVFPRGSTMWPGLTFTCNSRASTEEMIPPSHKQSGYTILWYGNSSPT